MHVVIAKPLHTSARHALEPVPSPMEAGWNCIFLFDRDHALRRALERSPATRFRSCPWHVTQPATPSGQARGGLWATCTSKVWLPKKQTRSARFHVILWFSTFRARMLLIRGCGSIFSLPHAVFQRFNWSYCASGRIRPQPAPFCM